MKTYEQLIEEAHEAGMERGLAAAFWFFDGNTSDETYRLVLAGIKDGDPAVMDSLPSAPLSGEWADDPTPASVLAELGVDPSNDAADDYLCAYEAGFCEASQFEIERVARLHVGEAVA